MIMNLWMSIKFNSVYERIFNIWFPSWVFFILLSVIYCSYKHLQFSDNKDKKVIIPSVVLVGLKTRKNVGWKNCFKVGFNIHWHLLQYHRKNLKFSRLMKK